MFWWFFRIIQIYKLCYWSILLGNPLWSYVHIFCKKLQPILWWILNTNFPACIILQESVGKEKEEKKPLKVSPPHEDVSLFYSDIMPLLVRLLHINTLWNTIKYFLRVFLLAILLKTSMSMHFLNYISSYILVKIIKKITYWN